MPTTAVARFAVGLIALCAMLPVRAAGPSYVDMTWMSISNVYYESVDLWIGTGGLSVAQLVLPALKPKAYLPVHWDGLWGAFQAGVPRPYSDPALEQFLAKAGVQLLSPGQYLDKWRLDRNGVRPQQNDVVKQALGFSK